LAHIARVVTTQPVQALKYLVVDGYFSKMKFVDGVCALDLHVIGKLRREANLRRLYSGPRGAGPGRPKAYEGKVDVSDLAHFEPVDVGDADLTLHSQGVNHPQLKRHLHVVMVHHLPPGRYALLFSTDVPLSAKTISRYYTARCQIERV
jgi:hypothetical protein